MWKACKKWKMKIRWLTLWFKWVAVAIGYHRSEAFSTDIPTKAIDATRDPGPTFTAQPLKTSVLPRPIGSEPNKQVVLSLSFQLPSKIDDRHEQSLIAGSDSQTLIHLRIQRHFCNAYSDGTPVRRWQHDLSEAYVSFSATFTNISKQSSPLSFAKRSINAHSVQPKACQARSMLCYPSTEACFAGHEKPMLSVSGMVGPKRPGRYFPLPCMCLQWSSPAQYPERRVRWLWSALPSK